MNTEMTPEHHWLHRYVGKWASETQMSQKPGDPPTIVRGLEIVRAVGDLWIVAEGSFDMPGGGKGQSVLTLGYDKQKKAVVGTWIGSMMDYLWVYNGKIDSATNTMTLDCEGPDCSPDAKPGATAKYQERVQFKDDDHRVFTSSGMDKDGKWQTFMTVDYRRVK